MRILFAVGACAGLVLSMLDPHTALAEYPEHEVWIGGGGAASFEKSIFNVPVDIKSRPDVVVTLGYVMNLDARQALCFHIYGGTETTPEVVLQGSSGNLVVRFELNSYNLGGRYRYTFTRGRISPYGFAGLSWATGTISSGPTGELDYNGVSGCIGPGGTLMLGRRFMLSAEGFVSLGIASWKTTPFTNSVGKEFNPSLAGGTVQLSFVWGWRD